MSEQEAKIGFWTVLAVAWGFLIAASVYNSVFSLLMAAVLAVVATMFITQWMKNDGGDPPGPIQPA